jgi:hypothetical protein
VGQKLVSPATYWRRRVVTLAAGLAVLTLLTWAVNVALGGSRAAGQGSPRAAARHVTGPRSHSRAEGHRQTLAGDAVALGLQQRPHPRPPAPRPKATAVHVPGAGPHACLSSAVTLTLRAVHGSYGPGQPATFVVRAIHTGTRPCPVNLGSRFVSVVVASGATPIWDSSSCLRGTGSRVVTIRRGVPVFLQVSWDRRTSLSGCAGQGKAVRAGTYTAAAFDGQVRSQSTSFVLSGSAADES